MDSPDKVNRIQAEYQSWFDQWDKERDAYIAEHGTAAWDALVDREIRELYPEPPAIKGNKP